MINLPQVVTSDDLVVLGALLFFMIIARFHKDETRLASYALLAVLLTDNVSVLVVVPFLAMITKNLRFG